jgi:hypothetical protein
MPHHRKRQVEAKVRNLATRFFEERKPGSPRGRHTRRRSARAKELSQCGRTSRRFIAPTGGVRRIGDLGVAAGVGDRYRRNPSELLAGARHEKEHNTPEDCGSHADGSLHGHLPSGD